MNPFATITNKNVTEVVDFRTLSRMLTSQYVRDFRLTSFGERYIPYWQARLGWTLLALCSFCTAWVVSTLTVSNHVYQDTHVTLLCVSAVTAVTSASVVISFYQGTKCTLARIQTTIEGRLIEDRLLHEFPNAEIRRTSALGVKEDQRLNAWMSMKLTHIHILDGN